VRHFLLLLAFSVALPMSAVWAQEESLAIRLDSSILIGKWTYRSFHNNPAPVDDDPTIKGGGPDFTISIGAVQ
jgi:hypothetical protein